MQGQRARELTHNFKTHVFISIKVKRKKKKLKVTTHYLEYIEAIDYAINANQKVAIAMLKVMHQEPKFIGGNWNSRGMN